MKYKNAHLLVSACVIIPVAIVYGFNPGGFLNKYAAIETNRVNMAGMLKATMGGYLAMASVWIIGIVKTSYWKIATIVNILFMSGLAFGRLISGLTDGVPAAIFIAGFFAEILLATWGIFNLLKYKQ